MITEAACAWVAGLIKLAARLRREGVGAVSARIERKTRQAHRLHAQG